MPVYMLGNENVFPDPNEAEDTGLLAVGGDLSTERLLLAYKSGIFPWYSEDDPILWFSPDPRLIFELKEYNPGRTLKKLINSNKYIVKIDTNFDTVIKQCAKVPRQGQSGTWITDEMIQSYIALHNIGYAHSFETYFNDELVGGLYGISLGGAFFGESMFHHKKDASKIAFHHLILKCREFDFDFIDSQVPTDHMKQMGCIEISRTSFLKKLTNTLIKVTVKGHWT